LLEKRDTRTEIVEEAPVHEERRERQVQEWQPSPEVLREYGYVKAFVQTWNPNPWIRRSYHSGGVVWWLMVLAQLGWLLGATGFGLKWRASARSDNRLRIDR
jgi:hypothetical protein